MKLAGSYRPQDIRNLALVGHAGTGKSALATAMLRAAGVTGLSVSATTEPSVSSTPHFAAYQGKELNIIDTPGHPELVGQALAVLPAVETAIIVVDAVSGIQLGTRRMFDAAGELGLARMVLVHRIDQNPHGLAALYARLKDELGGTLHAINLPARGASDVVDCFDHESGTADFGSVADIHREMIESSVEIDDQALERYLGGETLDLPDLRTCFVRAMAQGHVVPVLFASAKTGAGIEDLLHIVVEECPSPIGGRPRRLKHDDAIIEVPCDPDASLLAHVFSVTADPHLGRIAMLRILQGKLDAATTFVGHADKKPRKALHVLKIEGREQREVDGAAYAGDIVALARVEELHVGQVLHAPSDPRNLAPLKPRYPEPMISVAIRPVEAKDDTKLAAALAVLSEEDPTLIAGPDPDTQEFVLRAIGEAHLKTALEKLQSRHTVSVTTSAPRIAYRETVTARAEGHHRHKKQTGGAGQFGEVFLRIEPLPRGSGTEIEHAVVGGAIPKQFMSSVDKGIEDALAAGPLTGSRVVDLKVTVYDGKSHPVDGKDIAFRTAARVALLDAITRARAIVLEPVVAMDASLPEAVTGTVTGNFKSRRGRVIGVETTGPTTIIHAHLPLAELGMFAADLRGATGGEGAYTASLAGFEPTPPTTQRTLMEAYKPKADPDA